MKERLNLKKINFFNILYFIIGFVLSYIIPQTAEVLINKIVQYALQIFLISLAFFYLDKSNLRLKFLLGGVITAISFQFLNFASYFINIFFHYEVRDIFLIIIVLFALLFFNKVRLNVKYLIVGLMLSVILQSVMQTYVSIKYIMNHPTVWDFLCYYLNGNVAIQGLNFYEPENFIRVFNQLNVHIETDSFFYSEVVKAAFPYFPQNIFVFLPLGLSDFITTHIIWDFFLILFMLIDVFLICKIFHKEKNLIYYLSVIPLFLLFEAVGHIIYAETVTFIMLFIVLLIWKEKNDNLMGLWLSLGLAVKPIMLLFFLYPLLRKKWKAFFYAVLYTIISFIITIIFFGPSTIFSFFTKNTIQNLPSTIWNDHQSLLPTILRLTNYDFSLSSPLFHPMFIIVGSIISLLSLWLIYKIDKNKDELALSILILFALIIYPSTVNNYIILVIPVIFFLLNSINVNKNLYYIIPMIIIAAYYFMFYLPFLTSVILWLFLVYFSFYELKISKLQTIEEKSICGGHY